MTLRLSPDQLINRIHEAALVPDIWPEILGEMGEAIGGNGGVMFAVRDGYVRGVNSIEHHETMRRFMSEGWSEKDQTLKRAFLRNHAGFLGDADLFTEDELAQDEVYRDFYRKHGLDYRAGTIIPMPIGDSVAVIVFRSGEQGPVDERIIAHMDSMRAHLARSSLIANRLGFEKARAQAEALQMLGLPGMVLRNSGRAFAANALFEALIPTVFQDRMQRISIAEPAADALLANALSSLSLTQGVRSIPVPGTDNRVPMIVHLVPVRGAAHDLFSQATALMVVTPVDRASVPTADVLQGLFDLTPAEARVARGIGEARTISDIADIQGSSRETVRTQVKAVLEKTGLDRQQQLVSLLAGQITPQ